MATRQGGHFYEYAMKQAALSLKGICKTFGTLKANDNISLELNCGEIIALLGENGAGKTTLMNILFGHYVADSGTISVFNSPLPPGSPQSSLASGIGMVHQHFTLADNMSVLDNITLGTESLFSLKRKKTSARKKLAELASKFGLEVNPKARVKDLSVGQQQRVEILKALYRDVKILILDEPTAVLTPQESATLFSTLRLLVAEGLAVIFITHKLKEVISASDRCTVLRHGKVVFESITANTSIDELASAMVGGEINRPAKQKKVAGPRILHLENIKVESDSKSTQLEEINLSLHSGEILGIVGVSGNGQKRLADLISGMLQPQSGQIFYQDKELKNITPQMMINQGLGRIPEDRTATGLIGDMSIEENFIAEKYRHSSLNFFGFLRFAKIRQQATRLLKQFDVRCSGPSATTRLLSGGNMQKLILARVLDTQPTCILASQPTWGLDVGATSFVHQQLLEARDRGTGILLISEDLDELFQMADRIQVIYKGKLSEPFLPHEVDATTIGRAMSGHSIGTNTLSQRRQQ